jgi:hypothetical protein
MAIWQFGKEEPREIVVRKWLLGFVFSILTLLKKKDGVGEGRDRSV